MATLYLEFTFDLERLNWRSALRMRRLIPYLAAGALVSYLAAAVLEACGPNLHTGFNQNISLAEFAAGITADTQARALRYLERADIALLSILMVTIILWLPVCERVRSMKVVRLFILFLPGIVLPFSWLGLIMLPMMMAGGIDRECLSEEWLRSSVAGLWVLCSTVYGAYLLLPRGFMQAIDPVAS